MSTFATLYRYELGSDAARDHIRPAHRSYLGELADQGKLLVSGPFVGGDAGALLVLEGESAADVRALLNQDPFVEAGLVAEITIREWSVVSGRLAPQF